jgi:hypothetical protein
MLDTFKIDEDSFITLSTSLNEYRYIYNDLVMLDFDTSILGSFNMDSTQTLESNIFSFLSLESMIDLSSLKNDIDQLVKVFPSIEDDIELLDLWTRFGEEYLQEVESTPDVKLYYPEPFIASPSFVHEELWFIHILHYQHWL